MNYGSGIVFLYILRHHCWLPTPLAVPLAQASWKFLVHSVKERRNCKVKVYSLAALVG